MTKFTLNNLEYQLLQALLMKYEFVSCLDFVRGNYSSKRIIINRIDIDVSCEKAGQVCNIFNKLDIRGTFFVRLHAQEYNPFDFENYQHLRYIKNKGHEIGYHSEIMDLSKRWGESSSFCLVRDIDILNRMLQINIRGAASHNNETKYNNLDFWKYNKPSDFGLEYEAYDFFDKVFYISDSGGKEYKCYNKGKLIKGDNRSLLEHLEDEHNIIYLLMHPIYYEN